MAVQSLRQPLDHTVIANKPYGLCTMCHCFYAILVSDPLCRITVTVNSPQFSRLECP
ncbi:hypothetical protein EMIT0196P_70264 [Pseudomonas chlororaphis]